MSWAQDLVRSDDWLVVDVETTDLTDDREPVEIAVVDPRGKLLLTTLLRSLSRPTPEAVRLHGLGDETLRAAPAFAEVAPALRQHVDGRRVVAFNAPFDQRTIERALLRHQQPPIDPTWSCLMQRWEDYCGFRCSLSVACALVEIPPCGPLHRAAPDALRAWHLVQAIATQTAL